ncbi:hypothetical protein [Acidovorax sp.]|uniref:hypothetical protein n=1 Tax=Acidovorax sp. TaxID=1872122 RepID=UPI00262DD16F|nr:hypothetical protein [Acidovorax sp.]
MKFTEEEVVRALTYDGIPIARCVLIDDVMPGFIDEKGQLMVTIIEDDKLADAAVKLLRKRGQLYRT